jgi:hypothetical protein
MPVGTTATAQPVYINLNAYLGPGDITNTPIIQYQSAASLTASTTFTYFQQIATSATLVAFNLATLITAPQSPIIITVQDTTVPGVGFNISTVSGSGKITIQPGGVYLILPGATALAPTPTLPTVYIDNGSSSSVLDLLITAICQ